MRVVFFIVFVFVCVCLSIVYGDVVGFEYVVGIFVVIFRGVEEICFSVNSFFN